MVARQRAEMDRLRDLAAQSAVVEQAKGVVMALTHCTPDAAEEELQRRAEAEGRSLLEECWITLGGVAPTPAATPPEPESAVPATDPTVPPSEAPSEAPVDATVDAAGPVDLGPLGRELVRVATPQELARCLLDHLAPDVGADAVMIYARLPSGGLELMGHAGVDDTLAAQWQQVPPLGRISVLHALRAGEPLWLEDSEADRERFLLIDRPERWRSRAWLPVPNRDSPDVCIGVLRSRLGPFSAHTREHLQTVARLCAGRLLAFATRPEDTADASAGAVQAVFDALSGAAMLLAPLSSAPGAIEDYRIEAAAEEAVDDVGRTGRELVGRRFRECCPALAGEPMWQGLRRALESGKPYESEPFAHQELVDGVAELFTYTVRAARLGESLVVTWVRHGPSDRQEQRLADLQRLGSLGWASWNLVTHEVTWSSQVFALFDRDPARGPVGLTELPHLALPEDMSALSHAIGQLLVDGRTFDVPFRVRTADGLRHLRAVAEAVPDSSGKTVEVHGVVQDLTAQRSAELALIESERAILTQHDVLRAERTLAGRLQHTLLPLPTRPVQLAGLRVEVAYLPAQSGVHVGGDWFSVLELPDGDAVFVVGDVAGHGIDAVATMALLRFTAKGMLITGSSLTGALARLNTLLLHSRDSHGTATLVLARYHPAERRLVWAQAGHPPPLLLRDGEVHYLERPHGMLLGASSAPVFAEAECRLEPGDRVLLYTDGLVERPAEGIDRGLKRLSDAVLTQHTDEPGSQPLGLLLASMLEGGRRDDVCVLDIRAPLDAR
ncbi:SpoIIE family protein phosphatase [Streptomyces spinosisporus]|uniref:SpoIIE family protein phosphatase n=1 Tax=Streptomyces spinosisporus TaxID=2927582 RepID=A0ABS9XVM9_9ACTN|nr:SpoIIE family protein phosphatase [Streptomyces spinosisporus]MCI3246135.1 SpoIIE family protein phosphatase [Streptomyces spinosisporus]